MSTDFKSNKKVQKFLFDRGIHVERTNKNEPGPDSIYSKMSFQNVVDLVNDFDALKKNDLKKLMLDNGYCKDDYNQWEYTVVDHDKEFCGGSYAILKGDLNGNADMEPFKRAYEELMESDILRKLMAETALMKPRRRRRMSEHDGEWDYDKRWELKPFQKCYRERSGTKRITLLALFTIRGHTSASTITKYGAFIWALAKIIEDAGVLVEVVYRQSATGTGGGTRIKSDIVVKRTDEYVPPQILAACFTPNFYRRLGFGMRVLTVPYKNESTCYVGGSVESNGHIKFKNGVLEVQFGGQNKSFDVIEAELLKILKHEGRAHEPESAAS